MRLPLFICSTLKTTCYRAIYSVAQRQGCITDTVAPTRLNSAGGKENENDNETFGGTNAACAWQLAKYDARTCSEFISNLRRYRGVAEHHGRYNGNLSGER